MNEVSVYLQHFKFIGSYVGSKKLQPKFGWSSLFIFYAS